MMQTCRNSNNTAATMLCESIKEYAKELSTQDYFISTFDSNNNNNNRTLPPLMRFLKAMKRMT